MPRTRYETYIHQPRHSAARVELWDTSGAPDLATVQLLAHIHWDVVFLCFDISDSSSLQAIVAWVSAPPSRLFSLFPSHPLTHAVEIHRRAPLFQLQTSPADSSPARHQKGPAAPQRLAPPFQPGLLLPPAAAVGVDAVRHCGGRVRVQRAGCVAGEAHQGEILRVLGADGRGLRVAGGGGGGRGDEKDCGEGVWDVQEFQEDGTGG
jgi:hypothetical protein